MSYTNAADWITDTISTPLTDFTIKSGEGLDYEAFINTGAGKVDSAFVTLDSIMPIEEYESAQNSLYEFTTRVFIRAKSGIYAKVQAVINYYAGTRYTDVSGNKTPVILRSAMPSREHGRQVWELEYVEYRGLI